MQNQDPLSDDSGDPSQPATHPHESSTRAVTRCKASKDRDSIRPVSAWGVVLTECPVSTSDGVEAIDVAWLTAGRRQEVDSVICFAQAPEICVEILSPSNSAEEIREDRFVLRSRRQGSLDLRPEWDA
jgi:hypothetical protein